jgi:prepilin-type N-terminal cleavage/methylation domain-containing protein
MSGPNGLGRRAGFTLLEILVSIVLASVVALLVYGVVQAARDTQARVTRDRESWQRALAMRLRLGDALAGAQPATQPGEAVFQLESLQDARGVPRDRVTFVAQGNLPPLSPGADWVVTLEPTPMGLRLAGRPVGVRAPARLLGLLPGGSGLAVRVRDPEGRIGWSPEWPRPTVLPSAVELTYWSGTDRIGRPLVVSLALGQGLSRLPGLD